MRVLLRTDYTNEAARMVAKFKFPDASHALETVREDTELRAPDGTVSAILLHEVIPARLHKRAFDLWYDRVTSLPSDRPGILASKSMARSIGRDGNLSLQSGVNDTVLRETDARQENLGYGGKTLTLTTKTQKYPDMLHGARELVELIGSLYKKHLRASYETQRFAVKTAGRRLWHTPFSSIYLLKSCSCAYHTDSNNLTGVPTALTA